MPATPTTVVPIAEGGLGWDIEVAPAPDRYDAITVSRIIKQVNRRGRVRYFQSIRDKFYQHIASPHDIKGEDDRLAFIDEALSASRSATLIISFEERLEAKALARDLGRLTLLPAAAEQMRVERDSRHALAARHQLADLPERLSFPYKDGSGEYRGHRWVPIITPSGVSVPQLVAWRRKNTEDRYFAGVWRPGTRPWLVKSSWRYWRLTEAQWHQLIDHCRRDDSLHLLVHFFSPLDAEAFDRRYGPAQFVHAPPPIISGAG